VVTSTCMFHMDYLEFYSSESLYAGSYCSDFQYIWTSYVSRWWTCCQQLCCPGLFYWPVISFSLTWACFGICYYSKTMFAGHPQATDDSIWWREANTQLSICLWLGKTLINYPFHFSMPSLSSLHLMIDGVDACGRWY